MNSVFIDCLKERFANRFSVVSEKENVFIQFPAENPDFGGVVVYEERHGAYIVEIGKFTHCHIDGYCGPYDEVGREAAEDVGYFLCELFADKIICHGSHEGGGGFIHADSYYESYGKASKLYVWSGLYNAKLTMWVEVWFFEIANRKSPPHGWTYRPHLIVEGTEELLGVEFINLDESAFNEHVLCEIRLPYPGIDYSQLKQGAYFDIVEGGRKIVGKGFVFEC